MRIQRLSSNILLCLGMSFLPLLMAQSVQAQVKQNQLSAIKSGEITAGANSSTTSKRIKRLSEMERPSTDASELLSQSSTPQAAPSSEVVQVTNVKANSTKKGVEVILQTTKGEQLQLNNYKVGNNFIADILNAQLRLPSGEAFIFRSQKPIAGITQITVVNKDVNTIRLTVQGKSGVPIVELYESPNEGLIFSVASAASSTPEQQQSQTPQTPEVDKPTNETQPEQPSASGDEPIELVVTGQQDKYRVSNTRTGTKTDTDPRDIPQSIQVVPQQVLREQQATRLDEALRNASGVTQANASTNRGNTFTIRGFSALGSTGNFLRNGFKDPFGQDTYDLSNIERIEVLKGPASVLFGSSNPGGTINLITKQPLRDPFYSVEATLGSYDFYRGAIDLSGSLNDSKTVLSRLNVSYRDRSNFIDFFENQTLVIAPVLSLAIGAKTNLTLEGEYIDSSILTSSAIR